jgi:membrane-bound lytic murein transglycosylase A
MEQKMKVKKAIIILSLISVISGCRTAPKKELEPFSYDRQLPAGEMALRKITDPYQIPDFTLACVDLKDLRQAIGNSLNYMSKPSSKNYYPINGIGHERVVASLKKFAELLDSRLVGKQLDDAIRQQFDVYISVGCDDQGTVLFTGYYTPILEGSTTRTGKFQYPLYKQPSDLVKDQSGKILGRRGADGNITQYPPRSEIESTNMLKGNELVWLGDPFEAYVAHVQGSAKVKMPDGRLEGVGYAGNNGWDYMGISEKMIADGIIDKSRLSLSAMIEYFKQHQDKIYQYTRLNPRFVFFKQEEGSPRGSLNEPVTPMRSIATDKSIFPRGALTFISTYLPVERGGVVTKEVYSGFALDQDTGGAIRAPGRCDVYLGIGDTAGKLAGQTYEEGKLYYLFIKENTAETVH